MKNDIYDNMLSAYDLYTEQQKRNATFEVNQQVILAGLYNGGFFDVAAFYGGTCLRIFHGLQRFSEDMDFSLLTSNDEFDFTKFFQPIIDEFAIVGREVEIKKKDKKNFGKVESAFLKDNTDVYDISFQTDKSIKIKIEVDTRPPLNFRTEQKLLYCLIKNKGRSVSRNQLIDETWQGEAEFVEAHALTVAVNRLRRKLGLNKEQPEYIKTVYGTGYIW